MKVDRRALPFVLASLAALVPGLAEGPPASFHVDVDLVQLNVTVTGKHGEYIRGLGPENFRIREDGIPQRITAFSEGTRRVAGQFPASSVFVLFDTSDRMYSQFTYAEDAIAGFLRSLDPSSSAAVYTFSANMVRLAGLTRSRYESLVALRNSVAGSKTALYNALLLTVRDAARAPGRKAVVVFSNGPDNASIASPEDVRRIAEDAGIPIYIVSTTQRDPVSQAVFDRLATGTGGQVYYAQKWQSQVRAFQTIRDELASTYTIAYYPEPNANRGFRKIDVEVAGAGGRNLQVRTRRGYRPRPEWERPPQQLAEATGR